MKEIESLSVIEKAMLLSEWPLFERLATDELAMIAARTTEVEHQAGESVGPDSPNAGSIHLVVSGGIELISQGRSIRRAGKGEAIGSWSVMEEPAGEETLRILEPTQALLLSGEEFERAVSDHPEFAMAVIRTLLALVRGLEGTRVTTDEED
jgi:CRP-like cAMP-binding protein